ncbi:Cj0069 family protein [Bradyrhizobium tropiciagri]|uniref:Cj0069 family protein n=1 Tax=Bradyrhizobium tropiciagri TaxID=312253 RepID=UPI001BABAAE9|nr:Cj0069 family protein [Bradyrhizobium tropiciagri]MBR0870090.1 Cj0069 family protein [Bradyrhizobium tropiciagri]
MDTEQQTSLRSKTPLRSRIAILWRGDAAARRETTAHNNRFVRVFEALAASGIEAIPVVYDEAFADDVRDQLLTMDGVLVWVDPIHQGKTRAALDPLLREIATQRPWVSAHPDVILKMGVKEVLYRTRHLGWGTDTHRYDTTDTFRAEFPSRLLAAGPRVLKQNRGNGGQGVWKVEALSKESSPNADAMVRVLHAQRGSYPEDMPLQAFMARCEPYFGWGGCIIDQAFQPRLPEGMIRCYVSGSKVAGFGHQLIKALIPPPPQGPDSPEAQPGPRIMHGPDAAQFQTLRRLMEDEWIPQLIELLAIDGASLPVIWDADFLYGPRDLDGADTYVLCEINASSCFAIPDEAPLAIARTVRDRIGAGLLPKPAS